MKVKVNTSAATKGAAHTKKNNNKKKVDLVQVGKELKMLKEEPTKPAQEP